MKKYTIELTERQARLLSWACYTLPRLIQGQDNSFQDLLESAWEKRCKKATGHMVDDEFEGGWHKMREDAETFCKEIKRRFWDLAPNANYGIHYDETADIIWDIHRCLHHELWKDNPNPSSSIGTEPLAKVTSKDE